jgi:signal transduction histidine kinase
VAGTTSQRQLLVFSRKGSLWVIVLGALFLLGWLLNLLAGRNIVPRLLLTNPLTAVLFMLAGVALRRLTLPEIGAPVPHNGRLTTVLAGTVTLAGVIRLMDFLWGRTHHLDSPVLQETLNAACLLPANNYSSYGALIFVLCGLGLLLLDLETRSGFRPGQAFLLVAAFLTSLALVGYAYGILPLLNFGSMAPLPLNCAVAFELFCLAGLAARPDRGVLAQATNDSAGGVIVRRLLPAAILIPLILGAVCVLGSRRGYFEAESAVSHFAVSIALVFSALIWWNARLLGRAEQARARAETRLLVQFVTTRILAESPAVADANRNMLKAIADILGWQAGLLWWETDQGKSLQCEEAYAKSPSATLFVEDSKRRTFSRDEGLPGRVWAGGTVIWLPDVTRDGNFPRAEVARQVGFHSALCFPVRFNGSISGVMEFLTDKRELPDEELLPVLAAVGSQIGQFVERKRAEEQLRQTGAELARSNTELQQCAYVASHDLSEPLRMVVSYLQLLGDHAKGKLDANSQEFIAFAIDGAQRMQALINDLLAYARVDIRGRSFETVNCEEVLKTVLANLKVRIEETGAIIHYDPLPVVHGDGVQLAQVFQNLLSNAIKFRGKEPPTIHISVSRQAREWIFKVADNGIGINPKDFERIFVLFQRLHTRQEYPGTGMGLAICKKIIERHGGRMWVESEPGKGTRFYFSLPVSV